MYGGVDCLKLIFSKNSDHKNWVQGGIIMAGLTAIASKLRNLVKKTKIEPKKVSVVYFDLDGNIDWPDNCNEGVLAVPKPMSHEEWEAYCIQEMGY
jgi:hypothetical protein